MVTIPQHVLSGLDLTESAKKLTADTVLQHVPPLVFYHCLRSAHGHLADAASAVYQQGRQPRSETVNIPRKGFGPRPLTLIAPVDKLILDALVDKIKASLPERNVRSADDWAHFNEFGRVQEHLDGFKYLVELDIAACYEYIEHRDLADELIFHELHVEEVRSLELLLGGVFGRTRGLPQLSAQSDFLADVYLAIMERSLVRKGYRLARYADDFKVVARDWGEANSIIEVAADAARKLGLVLSTEKTAIVRIDTILERQAAEDELLRRHFTRTSESNEPEAADFVDFFSSRYGDEENGEDSDEEDEVDDVTARQRGARSLLWEWWEAQRTNNSSASHAFVQVALVILTKADERLPDELLAEIVFKIPLALEHVCRYITARDDEGDNNWTTLARLTSMLRQSPWAKMWLLQTLAQLPRTSASGRIEVLSWATDQLGDRHESVRCQASWALVHHPEGLTLETLARQYGDASSLTQNGLAACVGRLELPKSNPLVSAILSDSRLSRAAYEYAASQRGAE